MGGFVPDPACETTGSGSTTDAAGTDSGTSSAGGTGVGREDDGCGCRSQHDAPEGWGVLGLLALSETHHTATGRSIELSFEPIGDDALAVTAPSTNTVATPGFYMLFVVDAAGTPSVAKFVQVTGE